MGLSRSWTRELAHPIITQTNKPQKQCSFSNAECWSKYMKHDRRMYERISWKPMLAKCPAAVCEAFRELMWRENCLKRVTNAYSMINTQKQLTTQTFWSEGGLWKISSYKLKEPFQSFKIKFVNYRVQDCYMLHCYK